MIAALMLPALLTGCDAQVPLGAGDDVTPLADLGDPFVAVVAAVEPEYLNPSCVIGLDLYEVGADTPAASVTMAARGAEWAGTTLEGGVQYTASASWTECTPGGAGTGSFESSTFSGVEGDLFLFRYNGVNAAFEAYVQREDFEGGVATVTFAETSTAAEVEALADDLGVETDLITSGGHDYYVSWSDTTSVGEVLSRLSEAEIYEDGGPVWTEAPDWW